MKIKKISKRKPNENYEVVFKMYRGNDRAGLYMNRLMGLKDQLPTTKQIHSIMNTACGDFNIKYYQQRGSKTITMSGGKEVFVRSVKLEKEEDIFLFMLHNIPIWKIYKLA